MNIDVPKVVDFLKYRTSGQVIQPARRFREMGFSSDELAELAGFHPEMPGEWTAPAPADKHAPPGDRVHGVYELDFLAWFADRLGADTRGVDAVRRSIRAQQYVEVILRRLEALRYVPSASHQD